ncbi:MAG: hypothetical protein R3C39_07850 [Dehalococcoidia bacterium]
MDGAIDLDIERLRSSLRSVDHVLFRLTPTGVTQRLLVDFRSNDTTGPGVHLLPEVQSFAERLRTIERVRGGFPLPERLVVVTWPLRVDALQRLEVLDIVRHRLASEDAYEAIRQLDEAYDRLLTLQRDELRRAITGEGYRTLWPDRAGA